MSVIIASQAADRMKGGWATEGTIEAQPPRASGLAHPEHAGRISAIFGLDAFARVRAGLGIGAARGRGIRKPGQPSPINSCRPFEASGSLLLGNARFQACQQSSRCLADVFHVQNSLSDAHASCLQNDRSDLECPTKALKRLTR